MKSFALFFGTGSGKTFTSLARVLENETESLLIVCPSKVKPQWAKEFPKVLEDYELIDFPKTSTAAEKNDYLKKVKSFSRKVLIVNYEILYKLDSLLDIVDNKWTIILDESHKIKDVGTKKKPNKATNFALRLGLRTEYKIILTATPIVS